MPVTGVRAAAEGIPGGAGGSGGCALAVRLGLPPDALVARLLSPADGPRLYEQFQPLSSVPARHS